MAINLSMINKTGIVILLCLSAMFGQSVTAQELTVAQLSEEDFFGDFPVVLTATRLKQPQENSPIATTIIDREMIEASGFTEIPDLLRLAPGMLVNYDSGHIANAGYQFLFNRYTVRYQVLVDGRSVYTPLFGEMPWTQLGVTLDDIERIEVIRGPSSASYGPNAMTGVISIITRDATLDEGVKVKVNQGANGRSEQFFTLGDSVKNFDYKVSLGVRKDNGFADRYDDKDLYVANFRGEFQASNNDVVTLFLNRSSGEYQEDSTETLNDSMPEHVKDVVHQSQQLKWDHNFNANQALTLSYYQQFYDDKNDYIGDFTSDGYGFVPIDESVTTKRRNIELAYSSYSDAYSYTFGAIYREDNTIAPEFLFGVDKDIHTKQVFINSKFRLTQKAVVNLDLLHDDNDTGGSTMSPRVSLNYQAMNNQVVRVSYAESSRSPFVLEEYANRVVYIPDFMTSVNAWVDKGDLDPERIKSVDFGYVGSFNSGSTEVDLRAYKTKLSKLIVQDWDVPGGGFDQSDAFSVRGVEATVSQRFNRSKAVLNYAWTKIKADKLVYGDAHWYETGAPTNNVSMLVLHNFGNKISGSFGYYYTGRYQQLCCEADQQAPRKRIDLSLSKGMRFNGYDSKLRLVLQNISNEKIETRLFNNYDRQGYVSFSLEL